MPDDIRKQVFDKSKLPSRHVTVGPERAPHRSYLHAMGLTDEQIAQPLIGVVTTWNEAAPCNIALMRQAQAAKKGVAAAGGTPREFTTITVTDGIAMGHASARQMSSSSTEPPYAAIGAPVRFAPQSRRIGGPLQAPPMTPSGPRDRSRRDIDGVGCGAQAGRCQAAAQWR